jgi:hypothetical protein
MATIPLSDTSYTFPVDLPIKTIYWRVKAFNTDYSAYSSFIIQDTRVPFLIPFQPKITRETKPTLKWFTVSTATSYTIMIASNSSFTSPIAIVPLSDTTYFVSNALPLAKIFWKVASSLVSTYSAPDSFLIVSDTIPFLVRFNGATITAKRPTFQWYKVSSATSYDISIADNPSFTSALLIPVTDTSYIPTVDLGGMKYWRVSSSRNIALFSLYDSLRIDTTTTVISNGLKGSASKFSISYRNNSIMVTLPASFKGTATMSIFAISGKMIKSAQLMDSRDVSIDLRRGMYLIRVSNGSARFIEKLLVQ